MKYIKLIRFHSYYILGKISLIILSVVSCLFIVLFLITSGSFDQIYSQDLNRTAYQIEYSHTMILSVKMIGILIACFLYGFNFLKQNDNYYVFCLSKHIQKKDYMISKLISITTIYVGFIVFISLIYFSIGLLGTSWFYVRVEDITFFILFLVQGLVLGIFTSILTIIFNNFYVGLISYGVFIINEILIEAISSRSDLSLFVSILRFIFPSVVTIEGMHFLLFGVVHALLLIFLQMTITYFIYVKKDFSS
jgi:hypothetical protein